MKQFTGFPNQMQFTPIPNVVFSSLLPQITDIYELKVLLYIFRVVYPKKGKLRFISFNELMGQTGLIQELKDSTGETLRSTLESLEKRGVILRQGYDLGESRQDIFFLNTEANRSALERIKSGEIRLEGLSPGKPLREIPEAPADIFTLYEENIGMLTPLIADELKDAIQNYPENWIRDAIKEAVALNKRNWRYILRILEHWSSEGKDDGTHRRYPKKNTDPDKYIRGRYGHMVRR